MRSGEKCSEIESAVTISAIDLPTDFASPQGTVGLPLPIPFIGLILTLHFIRIGIIP